VAAGAAGAWAVWPSGPAVRSIAVLPFTNTDGVAEIDYLCTGLADTLARRLAFVPGLDVRARRPQAAGRGRALLDPLEAGRRFGVETVLTGSVRVRAGTVAVRAQLIDVGRGEQAWVGDYERPASGLLRLQHDLATAIVLEAIRRPLEASARRRFDRELTENPEAHDLYLRGLHLHRLGSERFRLTARRLLAEAVELDPAFAVAHVSLASTHSVLAVDGLERPTEAWPKTDRIVRRALEIDPDLPEALAERAAFWFFFSHDWEAAAREWTQALRYAASPTLPDLLSSSALMSWALGRTDEALGLARRARSLDPLTPRFAVQEADVLLHAGRVEESIDLYAAVVDDTPDEISAWLGLAAGHRARGAFDAAIAASRRAYMLMGHAWPPPFLATIETARGEAGDRAIQQAAVALELDGLRARAAQGGYVSPLDLARGYAQLGQRDLAFEHLDNAFADRAPGLVFLKVDRAWTSVRGDPRFAAAMEAADLGSGPGNG
jgi:TolB-like protein